MKKIWVIVCALCCCLVFLTSCGTSATVSKTEPAKNQYGYSLAPTWKNISLKQKKALLREIKASGKPKKGLSYYAYSAEWDEDGNLTVHGFIRNNTGKKITNITGKFTVVTAEGNVAKAKFTLSEKKFGVLSNGDNRPWTLKYSGKSVLKSGAVLENEKYLVKTDVTYDIQ